MKNPFARFGPLLLLVSLLASAAAFMSSSLWSSLAGLPMAKLDFEAVTGEYDSREVTGSYLGETVASTRLPEFPLAVLGHSTLPKRIEVDLSRQKVYAFEGNQKVYEFTVSTGKWGRTPTGIFRIANKFKYIKMSGGSRALHTYYYLPNVPYVQFFGNAEIPASRGFSFHGTYWHSNFGQPMSHGCVNMKTEDAKTLFYWADPGVNGENAVKATSDNPGTEVIIYGTAPQT